MAEHEASLALELCRRLSVIDDGIAPVLSAEQRARFDRCWRRHAMISSAAAQLRPGKRVPLDAARIASILDSQLEEFRARSNALKARLRAIESRQALLNPDLDITRDMSVGLSDPSVLFHTAPLGSDVMAPPPLSSWRMNHSWLQSESGNLHFIPDQVMVPASSEEELEEHLARQRWVCKGCRNPIKRKTSAIIKLGGGTATEARFCHYTGFYYCRLCHTNDRRQVIPARALQLWDMEPQLVSNTAADYLTFLHDKPVFCISAHRPQLYELSPLISTCRHIRVQLAMIHEIGRSCARFVASFYAPKSQQEAGAEDDSMRRSVYVPPDKRYLVEDSECWSLADLECFHATTPQLLTTHAARLSSESPSRGLRKGARLSQRDQTNSLFQYLRRVRSQMVRHVAQSCPQNCHPRAAKACGVCTIDEVIFSFDVDNVATCPRCGTAFHRHCWETKLTQAGCPSCARQQHRFP